MVKLDTFDSEFQKHYWIAGFLARPNKTLKNYKIINLVEENTIFKVIFFGCVKNPQL